MIDTISVFSSLHSMQETPILRSSLASAAPISHCFSLFSLNSTWNLESPSPEARETFMKALHQVLIRHGMKAEHEEKNRVAAAAAAAANPAAGGAHSTGFCCCYARRLACCTASRLLPPRLPLPPRPLLALSTASRALPGKLNAHAHDNNRTINFSDPTDFFQLQAKIGEGSYGSVYQGSRLSRREERGDQGACNSRGGTP